MPYCLRVVLERLCRKNDLRTGNPSQSLFLIGQPRKLERAYSTCASTSPLSMPWTCPKRSMFIASIPRNERPSSIKGTL
jgi:hypothetical protein